MSNIIPFNFKNHSVRVIDVNNEPWFIAKDVAELLGYSNPQKAIRDHCKCSQSLGVNESFPPLDPQIKIIPERDVYRLIMRSKMPEAESFEEWVVGEVLPQIRKTGSYQCTPQSFAEALQLAADQARELEEKSQALAIAAPKVEFADAIASDEKGVKPGQFAKVIGIGPRKIFEILRDLKILMTGFDRHNLPYQEYVDRGYFTVKQGTFETNSETRISHTTLITGKGEIWLRKKLLYAGYLKAVAA